MASEAAGSCWVQGAHARAASLYPTHPGRRVGKVYHTDGGETTALARPPRYDLCIGHLLAPHESWPGLYVVYLARTEPFIIHCLPLPVYSNILFNWLLHKTSYFVLAWVIPF